tara:strand:+ start:4716 stop:4997 length:282 start_codon:yes stop_codon:yes gene_type:complete
LSGKDERLSKLVSVLTLRLMSQLALRLALGLALGLALRSFDKVALFFLKTTTSETPEGNTHFFSRIREERLVRVNGLLLVAERPVRLVRLALP